MATQKTEERPEKRVIWLGSSLKDLRTMPEDAQDAIGFALGRVQQELAHEQENKD